MNELFLCFKELKYAKLLFTWKNKCKEIPFEIFLLLSFSTIWVEFQFFFFYKYNEAHMCTHRISQKKLRYEELELYDKKILQKFYRHFFFFFLSYLAIKEDANGIFFDKHEWSRQWLVNKFPPPGSVDALKRFTRCRWQAWKYLISMQNSFRCIKISSIVTNSQSKSKLEGIMCTEWKLMKF